MTIRYILVPNYKLGINLGITCEHLYVIDYKLDNDITEGKEVFTEEGYATISDSVNQTLYSYFQCIDESDFHGLYKLTKDFGKIDKFYEDMSQTMYNKHNNFTVSLFEVQGTHISCGVTISSKVRARGSLMTYPNYTDRYYVELDLIGDVLKVSNLTLLSRTLEGEPAIKTGDADTTGFMAGFEIDNDDRLAIEDLICRFGVLQLKGDTASDDFGDIVDLSMTVSNLAELKQHMQSIKGEKKVVWLQNYQQGSSNYASVKCKENVQDGDSVIEATVTYDFIHKGGKWYVYAYNINQQIRLNTSQLSTTGSLCLLSADKVESYNSQVKGTQSNADETVVSDISVSYEHDAYTPVRKTPTKEEKEDIKEIVKQIFTGDIVGLKDAWATSTELNNIITYDQAVEVCESFAEDGDIRTALYAYLATAAVFKINADANYYADKEEEFNKDKAAVQALYDEFTSSDIYSLVRTNDNFAKANNAVKQILDKTDFE